MGPFLFRVTRRRAERQSASQSRTSRLIRVLVRLSGKGIEGERERSAVPGRGIPEGACASEDMPRKPGTQPAVANYDQPARQTDYPTITAPLAAQSGPSLLGQPDRACAGDPLFDRAGHPGKRVTMVLTHRQAGSASTSIEVLPTDYACMGRGRGVLVRDAMMDTRRTAGQGG